MVEESDLKQWRDAGHVARRTLEGIKGEIVAGKAWDDVIDSAERFIRRHGGTPAFPVTISVNDIAAHYTSDHLLCLLYTSPSPRDQRGSRMPSSA